MNARVAVEDDEIRAIRRPGRSDATLVTLAALAHRPNGTWIGTPANLSGMPWTARRSRR